MFRSLRSLFYSHRFRLLSMGMIFAIVILIITLIEQIIINIDSQINNETKPIVGADLTIESSTGFEWQPYTDLQQLITSQWWKVIRMTQFYTTIEWSSEPKLSQVKAVEDGYPRYGTLAIESLDKTRTRNSTSEPLSWGVWIDNQTYELIGKSNRLKLWSLNLPVQGIITQQASLGFNFLDEGRTIIIPYDLISKTNLTDFWSRIDYELQIKTANDSQAVIIKDLIEEKYAEQYQVRLASDRIEQLWSIVWQLDQYTSTILIITLLLSLMVMATATMTMTLRIKNSIAIMRIVGLTRPQTIIMTTLLLGSVFVIWAGIGIGLAYLIFANIGTLIPLAGDFVRYTDKLIVIWLLAIISFFIACRQSLWYLTMTHPLSLLKQEWANPTQWPLLSAGIIWWWAWIILSILNNNRLFSAGVIVITGAILSLGYISLMFSFRLIHRLFQQFRATSFGRFDASRQSIIPGNQTWLLVGGLSSALIAFCVIIALSLSFIERLDTSAVDQPNLFILNVRDEDITTIKEFDTKARLYDTILWRIVTINNRSLNDHLAINNKRSEEFTREFNITSQRLDNSPVIAGRPLTTWGVSLDQDFAQRLGVWLGDTLKISIQGRTFDLTISSLRKSIRTWAEPFFFLQLDSNQFAQAPRSRFWVTKQSDSELVVFKQSALERIGKHLSFIDISSIILLVTDISNKIITIILTCMSIIIILILLVSIASNEASALVAQRTYRLYHIIGMTKSQLSYISRRVGILYTIAVIVILLIAVPLLLRLIYSQATILTWSWSTMIPLSIGIVITLWVMVISYRGFHRLIIKKL